MTDRFPKLLALVRPADWHRGRDLLLPARTHAQPLRREGASGRRAPRARQPDAGVLADRRRVAAAAAPAEPAACADRCLLSHRRLGRGDIHRVVRSRLSTPSRISCFASPALELRRRSSVALFALNPDVLYLQSTPMTEPLLFGLVLLSISLVYDWVEVNGAKPGSASGVERSRRGRARRRAGVLPRVPDPLRSMARHCRCSWPRRYCPVAARLYLARCDQDNSRPCHLSRSRHRHVLLPQLVYDRRMVRDGRVLRAR